MSDVSKTKRIFIASHPQSRSTALFMSLCQFRNAVGILEPFADAFFLGPHSKSQEMKKIVGCDKGKSVERWKKHCIDLTADIVVVKDHALFLGEDFDFIIENFIIVFIVRSPHLAFTSDTFAESDLKLEDFIEIYESFDISMAKSYDMSLDLFRKSRRCSSFEPLLITSAELIEKPCDTIKKVCNWAQLPYSENLLCWDYSREMSLNISLPDLTVFFLENNVYFKKCLESKGLNSGKERIVQEVDFVPYFRKALATSLECYDEILRINQCN